MGGVGSSMVSVWPELSVVSSARTAPSAGSVTRTRAPWMGDGSSPTVTTTCRVPPAYVCRIHNGILLSVY